MDHPVIEHKRDGYVVSNDPGRLDSSAIHAWLTRSYWSPGIAKATVERAIENSLCFGIYTNSGEQVGFARVITDAVSFAYLGDVYFIEQHQGRGLGHWLIETVLAPPSLQGLRRIVLVTRDAHGLYEKHGFSPLARPEGYMEIHRPQQV